MGALTIRQGDKGCGCHGNLRQEVQVSVRPVGSLEVFHLILSYEAHISMWCTKGEMQHSASFPMRLTKIAVIRIEKDT